MIAPQVQGYSEEFTKRLPYDAAAAKKLLAEAGYPNGFEFTLDCPNNRYINDEEICQAVTAMWAKVGLNAKLNAMPRATYFQKIQKFDTSVYLLGWATATFDGLYTLQSLIRTVDPKGGADGNFNLGKYSNPKADALIDQVKTEIDDAQAQRRDARGAADPRRRHRPHPAAPADDPVGDALERDRCSTAPTTGSTCAGSR